MNRRSLLRLFLTAPVGVAAVAAAPTRNSGDGIKKLFKEWRAVPKRYEFRIDPHQTLSIPEAAFALDGSREINVIRMNAVGDLSLKISRLLQTARLVGDESTPMMAQRMFWGMPGLEPSLAPQWMKDYSMWENFPKLTCKKAEGENS